MNKQIIFLLLFLSIFVMIAFVAPDKSKKGHTEIETNINGKGYNIELDFKAGKAHNHPTIALWIEDLEGNLIQPLFVTKSYGKGIYRYGKKAADHWEKGHKLYKSALPYFSHKLAQSHSDNAYFIPSPDKPIADAYTAATPKYNFTLKAKTDNKNQKRFRILMEINQPWDFNDYWHNNKFPDNEEYKRSCQPSIIYSVNVNINNLMDYYVLNPAGHGHYSGDNGKLYTDLKTLTSAKNIADRIEIRIKYDNK